MDRPKRMEKSSVFKSRKHTASSFATKTRLYYRYCIEILRYNTLDSHCTYAEAKKYVREWMANGQYAKWTDIFDENGNLCGFLITMNGVVYTHEKELHICEEYIIPGSRHKGLMKKAVGEEIAKTNPESIGLEIYDLNTYAKVFWKKILRDFGFKETDNHRIADTGGVREYRYTQTQPEK